MCGGTMPKVWPAVFRNGLSPRVRGNLTVGAALRLWAGSIPACAGEPYFHASIP